MAMIEERGYAEEVWKDSEVMADDYEHEHDTRHTEGDIALARREQYTTVQRLSSCFEIPFVLYE